MTEQTSGTVPVFTVGDRLRKARELTGLDQEAFAVEIGASRGTISNYERSTTEHRKPIVMRAWALATGVPLTWLETGVGEPPSPHDGQPATTQNDALARLAARKRARRAGTGITPRYTRVA